MQLGQSRAKVAVCRKVKAAIKRQFAVNLASDAAVYLCAQARGLAAYFAGYAGCGKSAIVFVGALLRLAYP
jgi:hypothetical protein